MAFGWSKIGGVDDEPGGKKAPSFAGTNGLAGPRRLLCKSTKAIPLQLRSMVSCKRKL